MGRRKSNKSSSGRQRAAQTSQAVTSVRRAAENVPSTSTAVPGGGGARRKHGDEYHVVLAMRAALKIYIQRINCEMGLEVEGADKFDDLYLKYLSTENTWRELFIQIKHGATGANLRPVTTEDLLKSTVKKMDLMTYALSHSKIRSNKLVRNFVLYTNRSLDLQNSYNGIQLDDSVFKTVEFPEVPFLDKEFQKFDVENEKYKDIFDILKQRTKLADAEIHKFLNEYLLAVSQDDINELKEKIREEISTLCKGKSFDIDNIYSRLYLWINEWLNEPGVRKSIEIIDFFESIMKRPLEKVFFKLREPTANFSGRVNHIKTLETALNEKQRGVMIDAAITGPPGIGKTQLALYYINQYSDSFDHIVWIDAENISSIQKSFLELAKRCYLITDKDSKSVKQIANLVYEFFYDKNCKSRTLFVFDNAQTYTSDEQNDGIKDFLPHFIGNQQVYFIVTSNYKQWPCKVQIPVDNFNDEEAKLFLQNSLPSVAENEDQIENLIGEFEGYPLALSLAVGNIKCNIEDANLIGEKYSIQDYIDQFLMEPVNTLQYETEENYRKSVYIAWDIILQKLKRCENGELSIQILNSASYFKSNNIPTSMFSYLEENKVKLKKALLNIQNLSIVKIESGMMNIHIILQDAIRDNLYENSERNQVLKLTFEMIEKYYENRNKDSPCEFMDHVVHFWLHTTYNFELFNEAIELGQIMVNELFLHFQFSHTSVPWDKSLKELLKHFDASSVIVTTARLLYVLNLYTNKKYEDALLEINILLETVNEIASFDHVDGIFYLRGHIRENLGNYQEALVDYHKALSINIATVNNNLFTAFCCLQLAHIYLIMFQFDEVLKLFEMLFKIDEVMNNEAIKYEIKYQYAYALHQQGKYELSIRNWYEVILYRIRIHGEFCVETLMCKRAIARTFLELGKYQKGLDIFDAILPHLKLALGPNHEVVLDTELQRGMMLRNLGRAEEAYKIYDQIFAIHLSKRGIDDILSIRSLHHRAMALSELKRNKEAISDFEVVINWRNKNLGPKHLETLKSKGNYATTLIHVRKFSQALSLLEEVVEEYMQRLGINHLLTLVNLLQIAQIHIDKNELEIGLDKMKFVHEKLKENFGPDHPRTKDAEREIIFCSIRMMNLEKTKTNRK